MIRKRSLALLAAVMFCAAVEHRAARAAEPVPAPVQVEDPERVTMNLKDVPIARVLEIMAQQHGLNIVASDAVDGKVTVNLRNVHWKQALEVVLKTRGLGFQKVGDVLQVDTLERLRPELDTRVVTLKHLSGRQARELVSGAMSKDGSVNVLDRGAVGGALVLTDTVPALGRAVALLAQVDVPPPSERLELKGPDGRGLYLLDARNVPLARLFTELRARFAINIVADVPVEGHLDLNLSNVSREQLLDTVLGTGNLRYSRDGSTYHIGPRESFKERLITRLFSLKYVDGTDVKRFLERGLSPVGKLEVFTRRNRGGFAFGTQATDRRPVTARPEAPERSDLISVTDTSAAVDSVATLIGHLDVRPRQISIEVKIVEVTLTDTETLGIDWRAEAALTGASQPTKFPFNSIKPGTTRAADTFRFGTLSAQNLQAVLKALEARERLKILSSPRISTVNNQEASILIGDKFPITVETFDPQTAVRTVTLDHYEQIGVQLNVVPQISGDLGVNLIIHPAVSTVGTLVENRFPVIQTREADTQVLVGSGDTAVIGGLLQERDRSDRTGVPGLKGVPVIGELFKSKSRERVTVDLLIFVTPTIVPESAPVAEPASVQAGPAAAAPEAGPRARYVDLAERLRSKGPRAGAP